MDESVVSAILGVLATFGVVIVVLAILLIIAAWKIFEKAGEAGWKSLIPFYNVYITYKISWKTQMFWIVIGCVIASGFFGAMDSELGSTMVTVLSLAVGVIHILQTYNMSKAFGRGIGFTLGLLFLPNIFSLILGFGSSEYQGPQA